MRDIAIVGAGPAGAAAAIIAARNGLSTILIDRPGLAHPLPAESVPAEIAPILDELGCRDDFQAIDTYAFALIDRSGASAPPATASAPPAGYHIDRRALDSILRRRAQAAGADVAPSLRITAAIQEPPSGMLLRSDRGESIPVRYVIDASGRAQWLCRALRLGRRRLSPPLFAARGEVSGAIDNMPFARFNPAPDHWLWTAGLGDGRRAWTIASPLASTCRQPPHGLERYAPSLPTMLRDVSWRSASAFAGDGYLLAGDAAFSLDPGCGQGVLRALQSGIAAGLSAVRAVRRPAEAPLTLARYHGWCAQRLDTAAATLKRLYIDAGFTWATDAGWKSYA